jgi:hypothetical protein
MMKNRIFQNLDLSFLIIRKPDWKSLKRHNAPEGLSDTKLDIQYAGALRKLNDIIIKLPDEKPCEYACSFKM